MLEGERGSAHVTGVISYPPTARKVLYGSREGRRTPVAHELTRSELVYRPRLGRPRSEQIAGHRTATKRAGMPLNGCNSELTTRRSDQPAHLPLGFTSALQLARKRENGLREGCLLSLDRGGEGELISTRFVHEVVHTGKGQRGKGGKEGTVFGIHKRVVLKYGNEDLDLVFT